MSRFHEHHANRRPRAIAVAALLLVLSAGIVAAGEAAAPQTGGVRLGAPAPDFTLQSSYGTTYTLSDRVGKTGVVLVFFRGTW